MKLSKSRIKKPYISPEGNELPGVTTILQVLDKPPLRQWAWNMGRQGKPLHKATEGALDVGSLSHFINEAWLKGEEAEFDADFKLEDIQKAHELSNKFKDYFNSRNATLIHSELPLIDSEFRYGGTIDIVVECNGPIVDVPYTWNDEAESVPCPTRVLELWDYKTSKEIWMEHYMQVAAYRDLYCVHYGELLTPRIVLCSKEGKFKADDIPWETTGQAWKAWQKVVEVYYCNKELKEMLNGRQEVKKQG